MAHDRVYAAKRVTRLKAKLEKLEAQHDGLNPGEIQKAINSTKTALRRWLRQHPGLDDEFLKSITHGRG